MATKTVKATDYVATFGKEAVALGDTAFKAWRAEVWQPLGIKDRTAQQRADANGKGGTRAAMTCIMAIGFSDQGLAMRAAAYVRNRYYGNTSTNTNGISYGWFAVQTNMATVASNATFRADGKSTWRMVALNGKPKATRKVSAEIEAIKARKATGERSNSAARVVRPSDAELARQAATADIAEGSA